MTDLRATLRLQFHQGFTLHDALHLVPYFERLGISHLYASPLLTARPGSNHGYDVIDPTRVNPELGGEPGLIRLVDALHGRNMGLILDIVPNHMAVGGEGNPWWLDVLEWGESSPFATFFDIQWRSHDPLLTGQLLLPFLRSDYGEALGQGTITLDIDRERGRFHAQHFEHRLPITPPSYGEILRASGDPALLQLAESFDTLHNATDARQQAETLCRQLADLAAQNPDGVIDKVLASYQVNEAHSQQRLHRLLERQHYRVASWRTAADDINWRRFFDINELGALRVERADVFELTHTKIFDLVERGLVDGLRIDHVDGLANPRAYCRRLRKRIERLRERRQTAVSMAPFPIYVEKILGYEERLPDRWRCDGTTGYEFMNQVSLLQHDPRGEQPLRDAWSELGGRHSDIGEEILDARRLVLTSALGGDLEEVAQGLLQVARNDILTRDLTLGSIRRALLELIVHFPVYRTYAGACGRSQQDAGFFQQALAGARKALVEADWPLLDHLERWLGGEPLHALPPGRARKLRVRTLNRFQQLTSPVAAKAVEDTALYRSGVLLSRYDVGFDATHFSQPTAWFHQCCRERSLHWPRNLLSTATHDHKRGEDSRARLAVLSERGVWYAEQLRHWLRLAEPLRAGLPEDAPARAEELILYQTLLASWPLTLSTDDAPALHTYMQRVQSWQEKALREAKLNSNWSAPNSVHEAACAEFVRRLLTAPLGLPMRQALLQAVEAIAPAGAFNSLAQCLLKLSTPGVPDIYQGCEYWDFSLVDPDNRRAVDFPLRARTIEEQSAPSWLLLRWRDGRIKQWLIRQLLGIRQAQPALFESSDYHALTVEGEQADKVVAFARRAGQACLVSIVPRRVFDLLGDSAIPHVAPQRWGDTRMLLPTDFSAPRLIGLDMTPYLTEPGYLVLADVLATLPVNLLRFIPPHQEPSHETT